MIPMSGSKGCRVLLKKNDPNICLDVRADEIWAAMNEVGTDE